MVGEIVFSKAGRDRNKAMVITAVTENYLLVCDGKERRWSAPSVKTRSICNLPGLVLSHTGLKQTALCAKRLKRTVTRRKIYVKIRYD